MKLGIILRNIRGEEGLHKFSKRLRIGVERLLDYENEKRLPEGKHIRKYYKLCKKRDTKKQLVNIWIKRVFNDKSLKIEGIPDNMIVYDFETNTKVNDSKSNENE